MSSFNDSGGEDGGDICNIFNLFADSGSDQSGLSDDRLCFILCFVVEQNGVWKIYRLSSFFFAPARTLTLSRRQPKVTIFGRV
jgi:hypothetical protein